MGTTTSREQNTKYQKKNLSFLLIKAQNKKNLIEIIQSEPSSISSNGSLCFDDHLLLSSPRTSVESIRLPFSKDCFIDDKEYDRQLRQHYVLKNVLGGNIHLPITRDQPMTILNVACNFWSLDMMTDYPNLKINTLQDQPLDQSIDLIYVRDLILSNTRWSFLLSKFYKLLKPNGLIELVQFDFNIKNPGPAQALINNWFKLSFENEIYYLSTVLSSTGFHHIKETIISIPLGEWSKTKVDKEKGFLYKQVMIALFKSMKQKWISELGISLERYDKVIQDAIYEFDQYHSFIHWSIYTAKKLD